MSEPPPEPERGLAEVEREVLECLLCRLWESRLIAVPGEGDPHARLVLIGEAPGNRVPRRDELSICSRYWKRQLALIRPSHVLLLGRVATRAVLGIELSEGLGRLIEREGRAYLPTYHPAAARRFPSKAGRLFKSHLKAVAGLIFP